MLYRIKQVQEVQEPLLHLREESVQTDRPLLVHPFTLCITNVLVMLASRTNPNPHLIKTGPNHQLLLLLHTLLPTLKQKRYDQQGGVVAKITKRDMKTIK
jgi:hypothetical protein